jgi:hypothetical protein
MGTNKGVGSPVSVKMSCGEVSPGVIRVMEVLPRAHPAFTEVPFRLTHQSFERRTVWVRCDLSNSREPMISVI